MSKELDILQNDFNARFLEIKDKYTNVIPLGFDPLCVMVNSKADGISGFAINIDCIKDERTI